MQLTVEEQRILNGERGEVLRQFMELLVSMGECYDAPRLIPVNNVHITSVSIAHLRKGGRKLVDSIINSGLHFKVFTTVNCLATDCTQWQELGISEEEAIEQAEVVDGLRKIRAVASFTCAPYLVGNIPRFGEHIVWGEASAVIYANSVFGARTNPEGTPSGLASALIGKTPLYGLHLDENRVGQFAVRVKTKLEDPTEYGALALFGGATHPELIPVFMDLPWYTNWDSLKAMSCSLHPTSSAKMFHATGITPEARTEDQAFGGRKPIDNIDFGKKELEDTIQSLNTATTARVSWIAIGCPHCSISEVSDIVRLLNGRKVSHDVSLWVFTTRPVKAMADRMGLTEAIEKAGGRIACETCLELFTEQAIKNLGFQSQPLTTNSTLLAWSLPRFKLHGLKVHYGRLKQCIDAAVSGTWR